MVRNRVYGWSGILDSTVYVLQACSSSMKQLLVINFATSTKFDCNWLLNAAKAQSALFQFLMGYVWTVELVTMIFFNFFPSVKSNGQSHTHTLWNEECGDISSQEHIYLNQNNIEKNPSVASLNVLCIDGHGYDPYIEGVEKINLSSVNISS